MHTNLTMKPKPFFLIGAICLTLTSFSQNKKATPETYGIVVGISNYHYIKPLNYADRDADLFTEMMRSGIVGKIKPENLLLLKNDSANSGNFWSGLSRLCNKQLNKGDRVFIYFAGHGDAVKGLNEYYLLLSDCQPANDVNNYMLSLGAIDMYHLKNRIGLLTRQGVEVILVLDACRTNELPGGYASQSFTTNVIEANVGDITMLATGPGQVSVEHSSFGNGHGIFTYDLVDGFSGLADKDGDGNNDHIITLAELKNWVTMQVRVNSEKFNIKQAPVFCCDDKGSTQIAKVDSSFTSSWNKYKAMNAASIAYPPAIKSNRSGGQSADTGLLRLYNRFNETRKQSNLWGTGSADDYYEQMRSKFSGDPLTEDARYALAADFINFAQQKINLYLEGKDELSLAKMQEKEDTTVASSLLHSEYEKMKKAVSEKWSITGMMLQKAGKMLSSGNDSAWLMDLKPKIGFLLTRGYLKNEKENKLNFEQALSLLKDAWLRDSTAAYTAECLALMYVYRNSVDRRFSNMGYEGDDFYFGTGFRNDTAFYYFKKANQIAPKWVSPYRSIALKMYGNLSIDTAKLYMRTAISLDTSDATSYKLMAGLINKPDSSTYYYYKALAVSPRSGRSGIYDDMCRIFMNNLIIVNDKQSMADSVIKYSRKSIAADPVNPIPYSNMARVYDYLHKPDSAVFYATQSESLIPGKAEQTSLYRYAIDIYSRNNKPDLVLAYSRKLLALGTDDSYAALQIGLYFDEKKIFPDSAIFYYRKSLAVSKAKGFPRERIAYLLMAKDKNNTESLELLSAEMNDWPGAWRSYYNIACYYANREDAAQAAAFLEKALQRGLRNRKIISEEPYFKQVKDTEVFRSVVSKYLPG